MKQRVELVLLVVHFRISIKPVLTKADSFYLQRKKQGSYRISSSVYLMYSLYDAPFIFDLMFVAVATQHAEASPKVIHPEIVE